MFKMGNAQVSLILSDITTEDVDLLVNPSNNYLWMKDGVAGAIKFAGGAKIEREALGKGPIPVGDVVITSSGSLSCRHVAHAAIMGQDLKAKPDAIKRAVHRVLELAEEEGYTSIAFPAMGLGAGKLHPEVSAAAMLQPMLEMLPESSTIHEIRFCFLDESIKETFHQTLLEVFSSH